ncbi:MAG: TonB-dependent receptor [Muribaculaceae bacterium]|nr:TonB-dependent receptor [Muribaculaceae bacterium]
MIKGNGILIFLICGLFSHHQALSECYLGKVLDEEGNPLAGAVVKILDKDKSIVTDAAGNFEFSTTKKEAAKVQVSYIGFNPETYIFRPDKDASIRTIRLSPDRTTLNEIVVTATRTPKTLKDVPVVTRLISSDEIKKTDATNIQDLLTEELPGLEFGYAMSQEPSLYMSGFGGNAVLFLVDGERLAGETMDNVDYNRLNLENVGQVEIVKGASSALYGANAVGGVVNIISKESKEPWRVNLNSRYRSMNNEWRSGGDINFNSRKWNSNTSVQYTTSNTVKLTDAFDTESKIHNIFGGNTLNLKERFIYRVSNNLRLIARGSYFSCVSNRSNYDDHYHDYSGGLKSIWQISDKQNFELSYGFDQYYKSRFVDGKRTHDHDYTNRQNIVHALYTHFWGSNGLTVGTDFLHDYLSTYQFTTGDSHAQTSFDVFAQFDYNPLSWLNVVASVREDYLSASSNNAVTARLATMFKLKQLSIRASYAGGFRAPTLKEMFMSFDMAGIQMIYGNPDLKPERSHNFNLALERNGNFSNGFLRGSYSLTLSGYYNYYNRRITTTDFPGDDTHEEGAIYCNEDGVKVAGLDFNVRYRTVMGLGASLSYNYLHVGGRTVDSQFTQPRTHSATWKIDYDKQICSVYKLYAGISGRYLSKPESRYETDNAYSLWKFTLQQRVWRCININFVIDNLLNYKPKVYYWNSAPTTGRTWSIGLSLDVNDLLGNL